MSLADRIIEHEPYDAIVHPRYGAHTYSFTGADLNELREELIAGRQAIEDLREYLERDEALAAEWREREI